MNVQSDTNATRIVGSVLYSIMGSAGSLCDTYIHSYTQTFKAGDFATVHTVHVVGYRIAKETLATRHLCCCSLKHSQSPIVIFYVRSDSDSHHQ